MQNVKDKILQLEAQIFIIDRELSNDNQVYSDFDKQELINQKNNLIVQIDFYKKMV